MTMRSVADAQNGRPNAEEQWEANRQSDQPGSAESRQHSEGAADCGHHHSFDQKLRQDVFAARAHGFANADLFRAFSHRDQHDVHDNDAADNQGNCRHANRHQVNVGRGAGIKFQENVFRFQGKAIVLIFESAAAPIAHDRANLIFRRF